MPEQIGISDNSMNSASFASAGGNGGFPTGRNVGQAQLVDDLTWIKGKHTIKVGINYRYNKVTDTSIASSSQRGSYSFADMSDFANGIVNNGGHGGSFTQSFPALFAAHIRLNTLGAYVMDEWKVKPNLSFTLGLRFEHDGDPKCVDDCFARMNDQFGTAGYVGGANVPYNSTITTGLPTAYKSLETVIPEPQASASRGFASSARARPWSAAASGSLPTSSPAAWLPACSATRRTSSAPALPSVPWACLPMRAVPPTRPRPPTELSLMDSPRVSL